MVAAVSAAGGREKRSADSTDGRTEAGWISAAPNRPGDGGDGDDDARGIAVAMYMPVSVDSGASTKAGTTKLPS